MQLLEYAFAGACLFFPSPFRRVPSDATTNKARNKPIGFRRKDACARKRDPKLAETLQIRHARAPPAPRAPSPAAEHTLDTSLTLFLNSFYINK
ncbi:hypothetical protein EVAR_66038_1 [Eumeta japonica]|uniref:Uncharacterized protein n=1 Tax=Eumeta variegata TaxID=151549 RepID=A0A4C1Z7L2_EUMVA|nr:hypothetical protein EVAR_66038_1 [Eumeta japonica]